MNDQLKPLPTWVLIVSGIFALIEILVSVALFVSPASMLDMVDMNAKGVDFLVYMWATRQFALGFILAYATFKKSASMLTISYIFLLVMFLGDLLIGFLQKDNSLIMAALVMCVISAAMIFVIKKRS